MSGNLTIVKLIIQAIEEKRLISFKYTPSQNPNKVPKVNHYISEPVTLCVGITKPNHSHFYLYALVNSIDSNASPKEKMLPSFRLDRVSDLQLLEEFEPTKIEDNAFRDPNKSLVENVPLLFHLICVHNNVDGHTNCSNNCIEKVQEDNSKVDILPRNNK